MAQFGRAPRSGRGGRKFKSCHLDHYRRRHLSLAAFLFYFVQDVERKRNGRVVVSATIALL